MIPATSVKNILAFAVILIGSCLLPSLQAKDIIRDESPDGKFALRITKKDEGWGAAIINLKNQVDAAALEIYQNFTEDAHLVWSKDSRRVAYFEPDRRGGSTTAYFRKGSEFEEVSLPYGDFPACEETPAKATSDDKFVKTIEATTRPVKWLQSGELVLTEHSESISESGATRECGQTITIAFDSDHKASVKSAKHTVGRRLSQVTCCVAVSAEVIVVSYESHASSGCFSILAAVTSHKN